jgi:hypothetical protein
MDDKATMASMHALLNSNQTSNMADISTSAADKKEKEYFTHVPQEAPGFFLSMTGVSRIA